MLPFVSNFIHATTSPKHIGQTAGIVDRRRYKSIVHSFVHRKFRCRQKEPRQTESPSAAARDDVWGSEERTKRRRRTTTAKKYRGKGIRGEKKDERRGWSCRTAQQNHLTQREREMAKPTARIRGNRRVGAGFRLSVAIATSAALWLGERAADGKSLVRTIIPRVAILQSGPSGSVVLHPWLHTSRCFRLSLHHVVVRTVAC